MKQDANASSALNDLLSRFGQKDDTFHVQLEDGAKLTFSSLRSYAQVRDFIAKKDEWVTTHRKSPTKALLPLVKKSDDDTLGKVYELSSLIVSPKLTTYDWLLMAQEAGALFANIYGAVYLNLDMSGRGEMRAEVAEKKEPLSQTSNGETS